MGPLPRNPNQSATPLGRTLKPLVDIEKLSVRVAVSLVRLLTRTFSLLGARLLHVYQHTLYGKSGRITFART
jgi:hypothetical protein